MFPFLPLGGPGFCLVVQIFTENPLVLSLVPRAGYTEIIFCYFTSSYGWVISSWLISSTFLLGEPSGTFGIQHCACHMIAPPNTEYLLVGKM